MNIKYADADEYLDDPKLANRIYNVFMNTLNCGFLSEKVQRKEITEALNEKIFNPNNSKISINQISGMVHRLIVEQKAPIGSSRDGYYIIDDEVDQNAALAFLLPSKGNQRNNYPTLREKYDVIRKMSFPLGTNSKVKEYKKKEKQIKDKNKYIAKKDAKDDPVIHFSKSNPKNRTEFKDFFDSIAVVNKKAESLLAVFKEKEEARFKFSSKFDAIGVYLNVTPELISFVMYHMPVCDKDPIKCQQLVDLLNDSIFFKGLIFITAEAVRSLIWLLIVNHKQPIGSCMKGYFKITNEAERRIALEFLCKQSSGNTDRIKVLENMYIPKIPISQKLEIAKRKKLNEKQTQRD